MLYHCFRCCIIVFGVVSLFLVVFHCFRCCIIVFGVVILFSVLYSCFRCCILVFGVVFLFSRLLRGLLLQYGVVVLFSKFKRKVVVLFGTFKQPCASRARAIRMASIFTSRNNMQARCATTPRLTCIGWVHETTRYIYFVPRFEVEALKKRSSRKTQQI